MLLRFGEVCDVVQLSLWSDGRGWKDMLRFDDSTRRSRSGLIYRTSKYRLALTLRVVAVICIHGRCSSI